MTISTALNLRTYAEGLPTTDPLKEHLATLSEQTAYGLYFLVTCKEPTCADRDLTKWINCGVGTFHMPEKLCETYCETCNTNYCGNITAWVIFGDNYSYDRQYSNKKSNTYGTTDFSSKIFEHITEKKYTIFRLQELQEKFTYLKVSLPEKNSTNWKGIACIAAFLMLVVIGTVMYKRSKPQVTSLPNA